MNCMIRPEVTRCAWWDVNNPRTIFSCNLMERHVQFRYNKPHCHLTCLFMFLLLAVLSLQPFDCYCECFCTLNWFYMCCMCRKVNRSDGIAHELGDFKLVTTKKKKKNLLKSTQGQWELKRLSCMSMVLNKLMNNDLF